jgi:hypothetical protein
LEVKEVKEVNEVKDDTFEDCFPEEGCHLSMVSSLTSVAEGHITPLTSLTSKVSSACES